MEHQIDFKHKKKCMMCSMGVSKKRHPYVARKLIELLKENEPISQKVQRALDEKYLEFEEQLFIIYMIGFVNGIASEDKDGFKVETFNIHVN